MPAPGTGTNVDLNTICRYIGAVKKALINNDLTNAKTFSSYVLTNYTTINTAIQAATLNTQLSASPTLDITADPVSF